MLSWNIIWVVGFFGKMKVYGWEEDEVEEVDEDDEDWTGASPNIAALVLALSRSFGLIPLLKV